MKTSELIRDALDWAVAKCEGVEFELDDGALVIGTRFEANTADDTYGCEFDETYNPSTDWAQGGPIIERELIAIHGDWKATLGEGTYEGPTPLIAAMRCYVASKLGDDVEIPVELTGETS